MKIAFLGLGSMGQPMAKSRYGTVAQRQQALSLTMAQGFANALRISKEAKLLFRC